MTESAADLVLVNGINGNMDDTLNASEESNSTKTARKKVSFHDNVTDIDAVTETAENLQQDTAEETNLSDIFKVSEKINFFKNAFNGDSEIKEPRSLGHQTSIPQARLAFVTGMVQSPPAGNSSRAEKGREDTTVAKSDEDDTEMKRCYVVSVEVPPDASVVISQKTEMMATTLTYSKIFAPQKNMVIEKNNIGEGKDFLTAFFLSK